ncbi:MAG: trypsin-like peptidase domain-containing protein [Patescibacteria group bacterium]
MRKLIVLVIILLIFLGLWSAFAKYTPQLLDLGRKSTIQEQSKEKVRIVSEESVVVDIVEKISPSVVTVGIEQRIVDVDPFDIFRRPQSIRQEQDIGSGFVVESNGLIVTNKHVVGSQGKYKVITHDSKKYDVESIYRDPGNDIAIVKIRSTSRLKPVEMGDSSKVKVGQLVVAVGTPLGEFRGSVTKGIISGLGRGITAGSVFESFVERLDNVIQTDAAINPGNSGGPLVNSSGQVIGVNTAVASGAENIGFAIPINIVKDALSNFNKTGGFVRPYLGVAYRMISRELAILNNLPEGAYVQQVVEGSAAAKAGIQEGDIIIRFDGNKVIEKEGGLAKIIGKKKVGDTVAITIWRDNQTLEIKATLETAPNQ